MISSPTAVEVRDLSVSYDERAIVTGMSLTLRRGLITAIVGPNGCGKSTVLRSIARLQRPSSGSVLLDGKDIAKTPTAEIARKLAILPQSPEVPAGVTVWDLVGYGRYPHQGLFRSRSVADLEAMRWAVEVTNLDHLADRSVDTLSGGERQRAWIAMALAQRTDVLLLDEPTTFLDIHYQLEVLSLVRSLNREHGLTVGWVLHDLNQAAAASDHIVMLAGGRVVCEGTPERVMTTDAIDEVFGIKVTVIPHPQGKVPICLPNGYCALHATVAAHGPGSVGAPVAAD